MEVVAATAGNAVAVSVEDSQAATSASAKDLYHTLRSIVEEEEEKEELDAAAVAAARIEAKAQIVAKAVAYFETEA